MSQAVRIVSIKEGWVFHKVVTEWRSMICLLALSLGLGLGGAERAAAFGLDDVTVRAQALLKQPYQTPVSNLGPDFRAMQFGDYIKIQPNREEFYWKDLDSPFRLAFYHQGMHFSTPVALNEIVDGKVSSIPYEMKRFDFGGLKLNEEEVKQLGYAGFRIMFPINRADVHDEVMSLLGASYFRVIGKDQVYGLSGRGLAIDSGLPQPEEFPEFREFWIERPKRGEKHMVVYALMDSPRATGAFKLTLAPDQELGAVLDVESRVFLRENVEKLGIAPLTSMFLFGPNQPLKTGNFRPAIHDSNGLAIHTGEDEWIWRPLNNPDEVTVNTYQVESPKGFGLLQRGHAFHQYEDLIDRYDIRPSAWIEPKGEWGPGQVELIEIPTADETNDNIVSFWTPRKQPKPGEMMKHDYRVTWTMDEPGLLPGELAWVKQTRRTDTEIRQNNLIRAFDGTLSLLIDFEGPVLEKLPPGAAVEAVFSASGNGEIIGHELLKHPPIKGWRLILKVKVKDQAEAVNLRAALRSEGKVLSETWSYQIVGHHHAVR